MKQKSNCKRVKQSTKSRPLSVLNQQVACIDVGASVHYVCVGSLSDESVRRFGTFTQDLEELADWLVSLGVTSVAMEATGTPSQGFIGSISMTYWKVKDWSYV